MFIVGSKEHEAQFLKTQEKHSSSCQTQQSYKYRS